MTLPFSLSTLSTFHTHAYMHSRTLMKREENVGAPRDIHANENANDNVERVTE